MKKRFRERISREEVVKIPSTPSSPRLFFQRQPEIIRNALNWASPESQNPAGSFSFHVPRSVWPTSNNLSLSLSPLDEGVLQGTMHPLREGVVLARFLNRSSRRSCGCEILNLILRGEIAQRLMESRKFVKKLGRFEREVCACI